MPSFRSRLGFSSGDHCHPEAIQELTQSHLIRTKDAPSALIIGIHKGFRGSVPGTEAETNICIFSLIPQMVNFKLYIFTSILKSCRHTYE